MILVEVFGNLLPFIAIGLGLWFGRKEKWPGLFSAGAGALSWPIAMVMGFGMKDLKAIALPLYASYPFNVWVASFYRGEGAMVAFLLGPMIGMAIYGFILGSLLTVWRWVKHKSA